MKINGPHFLYTIIAVFAFVACYEFVVHGIVLLPLYENTAHLWRTQSEMAIFAPMATMIQLALVIFLILIYIALNAGEGFLAGLRFGSLLGVFLAFSKIAMYPYLSMTMSLAAGWFLATFLQTLFACVIIGLIYRRPAPEAS
jgi:hypothetical protein